jgi:hypothetical protein
MALKLKKDIKQLVAEDQFEAHLAAYRSNA